MECTECGESLFLRMREGKGLKGKSGFTEILSLTIRKMGEERIKVDRKWKDRYLKWQQKRNGNII